MYYWYLRWFNDLLNDLPSELAIYYPYIIGFVMGILFVKILRSIIR